MTEYINKVRKENKGKGLTQIQAAEKAIKHIIRNSPKYKKEFFSIIGIAEGKTAEEVSAQPFYKTMNTFKEIYKDKDLVDFFKSAIG